MGRAGRVLLRGLVVAVLVALGALVPAGAASAHTSLVSAVPGDGEVVAAPPSQLVLTFDDDLVDLGAEAVVTGPDGAAVPVEGVAVGGDTVTVSLVEVGPAGAYSVVWRVTSADGHPIEGMLSYTAEVAGGGPGGPTPTTSDPSDPAEPGGAEPSEPVAEPEMTTMGDGEDQPVDPLEELAPTGGSATLAWLVAGLGAAGAAIAVVARHRRR